MRTPRHNASRSVLQIKKKYVEWVTEAKTLTTRAKRMKYQLYGWQMGKSEIGNT